MNNKLLKLHVSHKGKCYYCGCDTVTVKIPDGRPIPDNAATIEHVYSRFDIRRYLSPTKNYNTVLSCRKCNHTRGHKDNDSMMKAQKFAKYYDIRDLLKQY